MKIPKMLLEQIIEESSADENRFRELLEKEVLSPSEMGELQMSGLSSRVKSYREKIKEFNPRPYELSADILLKTHNEGMIKDLLVEVKGELELLKEEEKTLFFPALASNDFSGHELQRQDADKLMAQIKKNGTKGINEIFDSIESSLEIGRVDFATILIDSITNYFESQGIFNGQPFERFGKIKNDFFNGERGSIKQRLNDLKKARKKIDNYFIKYPITPELDDD